MNLYNLPIHTLHAKRLRGDICTADIAESILQRIDETENVIHSFISLRNEEILEEARAADRRIQDDASVDELEGMPIAVKDLFSTRGIKTTCGSRFLENYVPPYESTVTQRLLDVRYNLVGKTNMDEFAMGSSTENSAYGVTRNPWNTECVPGGSSGGSATAVAAGQALAAMGSDTGGSIRQPASFNGIVGIKPTYGRISRWGMIAYASSFDQAGPLTRDVEDAALILEKVVGYDDKDATSLRLPTPSFRKSLGQSIKGSKIGLIKEIDLSSCDPEVIRVFEENLEVLKEAGAEIIEVSIPNIRHAVATYYVIAPCEASSNLGRYDGVRYGLRADDPEGLIDMYEKSRDEGFGKEVKMRILIGTFALSAGYYDAYYLKAQKIQSLIRLQYHNAFQKVDAIAMPVAPTPAFRIGEQSDNPLQMYLGDAFTIPANLAGLPGISIPGGFSKEGLPIGFQMLGGSLQEEKLIKLAHCFEQTVNLNSPDLVV